MGRRAGQVVGPLEGDPTTGGRLTECSQSHFVSAGAAGAARSTSDALPRTAWHRAPGLSVESCPFVRQRYGKANVRVQRDDDRHQARESRVNVILDGEFSRAYTDAYNASVVATDTMRNLFNVLALQHLDAAGLRHHLQPFGAGQPVSDGRGSPRRRVRHLRDHAGDAQRPLSADRPLPGREYGPLLARTDAPAIATSGSGCHAHSSCPSRVLF